MVSALDNGSQNISIGRYSIRSLCVMHNGASWSPMCAVVAPHS